MTVHFINSNNFTEGKDLLTLWLTMRERDSKEKPLEDSNKNWKSFV